MPKIDDQSAPVVVGSRYPGSFAAPCRARINVRLGEAGGLTQFGVNRTVLPPGAWSSQRHWHALEDEFVHVLEGDVVLIEDDGEHPMRAGESAAFKAGTRSGHHFVNRSDREAVLLVVGSRNPADHGEYPDIDLRFSRTEPTYTHKDGTPY
jgi:uncharacterized cupin superfamily protein